MYPMTVEGESSLREELQKLKFEDRPQVVEAIATAREFGDLKENAEYHAAKEQQSLMEARIKDIEVKLSESQIIDVTKIEASEKVIFGTTVAIKDMQDFQSIIYKIVGEDEANAKEGKISVLSPLAKNLIGKFEGDIVKFETPGGSKEYEIINVEYI
jgi:transcription elongation factor GreA|tara:strand:+ start:896 stop:1366 length:471 start_codon:yes stop_codon:yes gene_type:complete